LFNSHSTFDKQEKKGVTTMKATTVLSGVSGRYGAEELNSGYQRFLLRALILSSFIHFIF